MFFTKFVALFLLGALAGSGPVFAQSEYPLLRERLDPEFLEVVWKELRAEFPDATAPGPATKAKKVALVVVDITAPSEPKVASINGDVMMYAASLPKIAILLGAFVQIERGRMTLDEKLREQLIRMIRDSSNKAATAVLHQVGFDTLADILQSERYRLYDPEHNGGLWVGKDYGGAKAWKRDPLHGISHGATAMQVARFYYLLITDRLVSPKHTKDMLEILSDPALQHKFVKGLKQDNPDAELYRKSGTWRVFHSDSSIVIDKHYRYIAVAIGEHPQWGAGLVRIIQAVDNAVESLHVPAPK
jgi:beta-lactamase class A